VHFATLVISIPGFWTLVWDVIDHSSSIRPNAAAVFKAAHGPALEQAGCLGGLRD
jgi:hypothetical protein